MLSNAYFLAKIRFDTAENEPAKSLQNFANFPNFANPNWLCTPPGGGGVRVRVHRHLAGLAPVGGRRYEGAPHPELRLELPGGRGVGVVDP